MDRKHLTWIPPSEIDGEPDDVADIVEQQLVDLATPVAVISSESYTQLRAAGLEQFETVEEWEQSPAGKAAEEVRRSALAFGRAVRHLRLLPSPPRAEA